MALAAHRTGTLVKKCDRSNHKPDSNKRCASATCQHTWGNPEHCPRALALRDRVNGGQFAWSFFAQSFFAKSSKDITHLAAGRANLELYEAGVGARARVPLAHPPEARLVLT